MKYNFNKGWICYKTGDREHAFKVTLPHDAMQLDARSETSAGGTNTGWYEAQDYTYEKTFVLPQDAKEQKIILEFEGVYRKATVYINGKKAAYHSYGYLGFYIDATKYLKFEEENIIRVEVLNHDQPNSRWYSGTGIYRPVWLHVVPKKHLRFDSIKITTLDYKEPKIRVEAWPNAEGEVTVEILEAPVKSWEDVEGGKLLAFGSACPYYPESYQSAETDTYYGEALAIIRPGEGAKKIVVNAQSKFGNAQAEIEVI